jgi:flavodoxin
LANVLSADIHEIVPKVPYTNEDLNWMNKNSRSSVEMKDTSSRPSLADTSADISAYDTILFGFPIWWYIAPTIINTFLESYDFTGKKIVLFATSGGSGFGKAVESLEGSCPGATITEGKLLNHMPDALELKKWVESL